MKVFSTLRYPLSHGKFFSFITELHNVPVDMVAAYHRVYGEGSMHYQEVR